ncbi:hypothetical protein [[Mycoplasma] cavipharyngis]|uniref:hypothetical protein n=1 Tax=[Mycoplasma] cavipharyngis TaxID=92757 RepID=UPI003704022A
MINLYYATDLGILAEIKRKFIANNPESQSITVKDYQSLFESLEQNSLFFSPKAFVLNDVFFLTNESHDGIKNSDSKINNQMIDQFVDIISNLKKNQINVLILVNCNHLLKNSSINKLLNLVDNKDHKKASLNVLTKQKYIDQWVEKSKIKFDYKVKDYLYDFFPKDAKFIDEVFYKISLLNYKKITYDQMQQLVGNFQQQDFYILFDRLLLADHSWLTIFHNKCNSVEDAVKLLNILNYKIEELFYFVYYKEQRLDLNQIAKAMKKPPFSLFVYNNIYSKLGNKLKSKLNKIIVDLYKYNVLTRTEESISVLGLKKTLLSF